MILIFIAWKCSDTEKKNSLLVSRKNDRVLVTVLR